MGLFSKTEADQQSAATAKAAKQAEREAAAFQASPVGQARTAFEQGHRLFQVDFEVVEQSAEIVAMMGSFNTKKANTPTVVLNSIASEGWDLITGSFVFVVHGEHSRDKFMSSGQNVAVKGATVGYYLFRRAEQNAPPPPSPGTPDCVVTERGNALRRNPHVHEAMAVTGSLLAGVLLTACGSSAENAEPKAVTVTATVTATTTVPRGLDRTRARHDRAGGGRLRHLHRILLLDQGIREEIHARASRQ